MIFTDAERKALAQAYAYILSWTDDKQQEAAHEVQADTEDGRVELESEPYDPEENNDDHAEETA